MVYRIYMSDAVWGIAHGKAFDNRYIEIIDPQPEETRTGEEVIADIKKKLKGVE